MSTFSPSDLSKKLAEIDICILSTHADGGRIAGRPMSNNREVEYDGDSFYFTDESADMVGEIERDPNVSLAYQGAKGLFGKDLFLAVIEGRAELIRDKSEFQAHWTKELDRWFEAGVDTPGLVLIKVHAARIAYWNGEDQGELTV